ncbi:hypothetical protein [Amycolatopsis sp. lyj-23]|uniref:hypothetical protein n=1 Tax=Amycolatopsis sp. lyj-23 TaxID=2789283 RepID=UPI00397904E1
MSGGEFAGLATMVDGLFRELAQAHSKIVTREIEATGVKQALDKCTNAYLVLEARRRALLASPRPDRTRIATLVEVNHQLRAVRETLGPLQAALAPENRRPTMEFERRHGRAETSIEALLPSLGTFLVELNKTTGLRAPYRRRRELTVRVRKDDDTGSAVG